MKRPSWDEYFLKMALLASERVRPASGTTWARSWSKTSACFRPAITAPPRASGTVSSSGACETLKNPVWHPAADMPRHTRRAERHNTGRRSRRKARGRDHLLHPFALHHLRQDGGERLSAQVRDLPQVFDDAFMELFREAGVEFVELPEPEADISIVP